jgi:hypothetical protein
MKPNFGSLSIERCKLLEYHILVMLTSSEQVWKSLDINYYPPRVERLWSTLEINGEKIRVHLHTIHHTFDTCLYHKHKWPAVIHQLEGQYEMGITYSENEISSDDAHKLPNVARLIIAAGSWYEMNQTDALHYVKPMETSSSIMFTKEDELFPEADLRRENTGEYKLVPLPEERVLELKNHFYKLIKHEVSK